MPRVRILEGHSLFVVIALVGFTIFLLSKSQFSVRLTPDSTGYISGIQFSSWQEVFTYHRTFGYPLFLRILLWFGLGVDAVPFVQAALQFSSWVFFYLSIREYGFAGSSAALASLPLLFSPLVAAYSGAIMVESLAGTLLVVTFGLLLRFVNRTNRRGLLLLLAAAAFFCYQVKPAYLTLLASVPVAGCLLLWMKQGRQKATRGLLTLLMVVLIPFLLFCSVRWLVVGHFGMVSFGGVNAMGVAGSLIDTYEPTDRRDSDLTALAERITQERAARKMRRPDLLSGSVKVELLEWYEQHRVNALRISLPAAYQVLSEKYDQPLRIWQDHWIEANQLLARLSSGILRANSSDYAAWLLLGLAAALYRTFTGPFLTAWSLYLAFAAFLVALIRKRYKREPLLGFETDWNHLAPLVIAVCVYGFGVAGILLSQPPRYRYLHSVDVFLPGAFLSLTLMWLRNWLSGSRLPRRSGSISKNLEVGDSASAIQKEGS